MKKPPPRPDIPPRRSDNEKRRLHRDPNATAEKLLVRGAKYQGIAKHKQDPGAFDLPQYEAHRGDATLCDAHAGIGPADMDDLAVRQLISRGLEAGLIGDKLQQGCPRIIWTVHKSGWIFEARLTNAGQAEYHGYPVRPSEAIAEPVFNRFESWARQNGAVDDREAANACRNLYGFR